MGQMKQSCEQVSLVCEFCGESPHRVLRKCNYHSFLNRKAVASAEHRPRLCEPCIAAPSRNRIRPYKYHEARSNLTLLLAFLGTATTLHGTSTPRDSSIMTNVQTAQPLAHLAQYADSIRIQGYRAVGGVRYVAQALGRMR